MSYEALATHLGSALTTKRSSSGLYRRVSLTMAYSWCPQKQQQHKRVHTGLSA